MTQYWLLKSEPQTFSLDDLVRLPQCTTCWEGVRNYQARNYLRSMEIGQQAFFYHSNTDVPAIVGIVKVVRAAYPDHYAWDAGNKYFDPRSSPENPRWFMVDIEFLKRISVPIALDRLREIKKLEKMELLRRGSRLSVQPVRALEWKVILQLAGF